MGDKRVRREKVLGIHKGRESVTNKEKGKERKRQPAREEKNRKKEHK